jgi:biotin carboxyl carrier protein
MRRYTVDVRGKAYTIDVQELGGDTYRVQVEGQEFDVRLVGGEDAAQAMEMVAIGAVGEPEGKAVVIPTPSLAGLETGDIGMTILPQPADQDKLEDIVAPMPGVIQAVAIASGDTIQRGQHILVLEAMKMKNDLYAPRDGIVAEVLVVAGDHVNSGDVLARLHGGA